MRPTHLLALAAVAAATAAPARAQGTRKSESGRPETAPPPGPGRTFYGTSGDEAPRAAIGLSTTATGTARDTLGLLITLVTRGGPAEKAGLEEGNRIAAINGVSLRANAADVEDFESAGTLPRRLVRELSKVKPGDAVELRVYRDGHTQPVTVRTVSSDSLFRRNVIFRRVSNDDFDERPAIGIRIGSSSSHRDTLGVLVIGVEDSTPAARAGLEEGNRIAAINGVNLRVAREDAGDASVGASKAARLRRAISELKPNDNVTLRVYANGQFHDVTVKVARAKDLPHSRMSMNDGWFDVRPPMPPMPPGAMMAPMPPMPKGRFEYFDTAPMRMELAPEMKERLRDVRVELDRMRPELERVGPELERMRPELDRIRPQLERMRPELERIGPELRKMQPKLDVLRFDLENGMEI